MSFMFTFDGSNLNLFIAFFAGLTTFFASCLLPLVPAYLAFLSGVSLSEESTLAQRGKIFLAALLFVGSFIATFMFFGLAAQSTLALHAIPRGLLQKVAGVMFIVMGLNMAKVIQLTSVNASYHLPLRDLSAKFKWLHPIVVGVGFAAAWTPCIGPVLALILYLAAQQETALQGTLLLLLFGLGIGVPFLGVALIFEYLVPFLKKIGPWTAKLSVVTGYLLLLVGILLVLNKLQAISFLILSLLNMRKFTL